MKRSYLKRSEKPLKRTALKRSQKPLKRGWIKRKKSERQEIIDDCKDILRRILIVKRSARDEISGRPPKVLGLFHILAISTNPRLQLLEQNVLLVNWLPHHYNWHHYGPKSPRTRFIEERIMRLRGEDYRDRLLIIEKMAPKMTLDYLTLKRIQLRQELGSFKSRQGASPRDLPGSLPNKEGGDSGEENI